MQAGAALLHDDGARACYNELRARDMSHNAALRYLGNRLVGILHGCLKTGTLYNQATAWSHRYQHLTAEHLSSWGVAPPRSQTPPRRNSQPQAQPGKIAAIRRVTSA
jgi:hypothetical protein